MVSERFQFNSATQNSEGINQFLNPLRTMAASCNHGAHTEMITYRVVIGLRGKAPILRLLKAEEYNLDISKSIARWFTREVYPTLRYIETTQPNGWIFRLLTLQPGLFFLLKHARNWTAKACSYFYSLALFLLLLLLALTVWVQN